MRLALLAGSIVTAVVLAAVVLARGDGAEADGPVAWAQQASSVCERGLTEARALVAAADAIADAEERALHLYRGATRVEADVLTDLRALAAPRAERPAIAAALEMLSESHDLDVAAISELEREFDSTLLKRRVTETVPVAAELRRRFLALGADGCARYLNPVSY